MTCRQRETLEIGVARGGWGLYFVRCDIERDGKMGP